MKHFHSIFTLVLICALVFPHTMAEQGETMLVKILVTSHADASDYHVETADTGARIEAVKVGSAEEYGEDFGLYTFALEEGVNYRFVFIQKVHMLTLDGSPVPYSVSFKASAQTPEYLCSVATGLLKPFAITASPSPSPSPTISPTPKPTASPSPTPKPSTSPSASPASSTTASEKVKIETSDTNALILEDDGAAAPSGNPGETVTITLALAVNREYLPSEQYALRNITVEPDIPSRKRGDTDNIEDWPFVVDKASYLSYVGDLTYGASADVTYDFTVAQSAQSGTYPVDFILNATVWRYDSTNGTTVTEGVDFTLTQYVNVLSDGALAETKASPGAVALSAAWDGDALPAPRGKGGDAITVLLPIVANADMTDVTIEPIFSADADECPIIFETVNYTKTLPDLSKGESALAEYEFMLLPDEDGGNKPLNFKVKYKSAGASGESLLTTFLYVEPANAENEDMSAALSAESSPPPVVTLESFAVLVDGVQVKQLYADETANFTLRLRNNSEYSAKNLRISVIPGDALAFDSGESGTRFIGTIKPQSSESAEFAITAGGDAKPGRHGVQIRVDYEGENGDSSDYSHSISLEILQPVRIETEPAVVNDGKPITAGIPCTVRLRLLNLGMAGIRNIRAHVEGEGLSTHESFFGNTLPPSESAMVELRVLSDEGARDGRIIITYESDDGFHETAETVHFTAVAAPETSQSPLIAFSVAEKGDARQTLVVAGVVALAAAFVALVVRHLKVRAKLIRKAKSRMGKI